MFKNIGSYNESKKVNRPTVKERIISINLIVGFFLAFSGYYAALIVLTNLATGAGSRNLTIPLRLIIVSSFGIIFLMRPKIGLQKGLTFFLFFAFAYLSRILIESLDYSSKFQITEIEFFLYFTSFVLIPLVFTSQIRLSESDYSKIFIVLMIGTIILSILTFYFYKQLIGTVVRISLVIKHNQNYISPLALSYGSVLGIGVGIGYLLTNKVGRLKKLFIYTTIMISFVPFFLGASRGSILALSFPFVFYLFFAQGIKKRAHIIISMGVLCIFLIISTAYFGSGVFFRFANISHDIESSSSSAGRLEIWRYSLIQFINNPVFGNSLNCTKVNFHPHNILLEVLITTGIIGFIPFFLFLCSIFTKMKVIVKQHSEYFWICVIFLQAFTQNMFSGGIYSAGWLAIGGGLILGVNIRDRVKNENFDHSA
ncbi:MAG: O-antigen ligase family protein [Pseudomonadota bacterium]